MRARTIKEGSLGLFIFGGLSLLGVVLIWLTGATFSQKTYFISINFEDANGLREGAIVRYRGLEIGRVKSVSPNSNGVEVRVEVESADLVMPKVAIAETNQAGLVGEPDIEIIPKVVLSEEMIAQSPFASDCLDIGEILCNEDSLPGTIGVSFKETLRLAQRFSGAYGDPEFVEVITILAQSSSEAAERLASLTEELTLLSQDVRGEIGNFSNSAQVIGESAQAITDSARTITDVAVTSSGQLNETVRNVSELTGNINALVVENRQTIVGTLNSISRTSEQMQGAIASLDSILQTANNSLTAVDTQQLITNLNTLTENAAIASDNLRDISVTLNDPTNITMLQKTLDAARATFENTQKITSDLDELTGDPAFRKNFIDLINGLSQLVSSTEQLQDQIQVASRLEPLQAERELAARDSEPNATLDSSRDYQ